MAAAAPSAVTVVLAVPGTVSGVPAPSAVMAMPAAKPKLPVVQGIVGDNIGGGVAPAVNAPEKISCAGEDIKGQCAGEDIIPATPISAVDFTTWSRTIGAVCHGPWTQVTLHKDRPFFFGSNYGIHRSQSQQEPPGIEQVSESIKCLGLCSEAWQL